jgi:hypothetical protein
MLLGSIALFPRRRGLASTGGSNAIDATVAASAALRGDLVVTGDEHDLRGQHTKTRPTWL